MRTLLFIFPPKFLVLDLLEDYVFLHPKLLGEEESVQP